MEQSDNSMLNLYPVYDSRLESLQSKINYGLYKGADSLMYRVYDSNNKSSSMIGFNVKAPSLQACVDACFWIETQFTFDVTATGTADLDIGLGLDDGATFTPVAAGGDAGNVKWATNQRTDTLVLAALPLFNMIQTTNVSINNSPLGLDNQYLNDSIMRLLEQQKLNEYQEFCPVMKAHRNNEVAGGNNSIFNDGKYVTHCCKPNGSFKYDKVTYVAKTTGVPGKLTLTCTTIEPLLHPYLNVEFSKKSISNINTIDVNLNLKADLNQAVMISTKAGATSLVSSVNNLNIVSSKLHLAWLKAPLFMPLKTKTVTPFTQPVLVNNKIVAASNLNVSSDTITFNSLPSAIGVYCRPQRDKFVNKPIENCTIVPTSNVSVSFGRSGICSDMKAVELQTVSKRNGLVDQTNENWYGRSAKPYTVGGGAVDGDVQNYYRTIGPMLLFNPVLDFGVSSSLSNSSEGSFDFQINVSYQDTTSLAGGTYNYEFGIIAFYDGLLVNSLGSSFIWTGMITNEMALSQDVQPPVAMSEHKLVGGGLFDRIANFGSKMLKSDVGKLATSLIKNEVCGNGAMYR